MQQKVPQRCLSLLIGLTESLPGGKIYVNLDEIENLTYKLKNSIWNKKNVKEDCTIIENNYVRWYGLWGGVDGGRAETL